MRPRIVMIILAVIVAVGIGAALFMQQRSTQPDPTTTPGGETTPPPVTSTPTPTPAETPAPTAQAPLDLTPDANGLSKSTVAIETAHGKIRFKFYPKDAPTTVKRIAELVQQGFYNGLTFHRVVPGFVVQGGDPKGDGTGGSGQKLKAEFNERHHQEGSVAMARAQDPDSADSQFYIALGPQPHLDRQYTVFGQVIEGMDAVKKLAPGDKMISLKIE